MPDFRSTAALRPFRSAAIGVIRGTDAMVGRLVRRLRPRAQRRVLFDVRNRIGFEAQAPVIRELQARGVVDVDVASGLLDDDDLRQLLGENGLGNARVVSPRLARHRRYDLIVLTDSRTIPVWRRTRVAYLHHGSSFGNIAEPYAFGFLRDGSITYLFCLTEPEVANAIRLLGEEVRSRLIVTGQPKLDGLTTGAHDRDRYLASLGLDPALPTVLLSSHWSAQSLFRGCDIEPLAEFCAAHDINVLVTAHQHLLDCGSRHYSGGVDWLSQLERRFDGPRMRILARLPSRWPMLAASDVMVGDHSSLRLEYATLFRPIVMFRHPDHEFSDPELERRWCHTAAFRRDGAGLVDALAGALAEPSVDRARRQELLDYATAYLGRSAERTAGVVEALATGNPPPAGTPATPHRE